MGQAGSLPETSALSVAVAVTAGGGARSLKGRQVKAGAAARSMSGDGDGNGGETDCAEALVGFQRLVTVAVQKGVMGMSDARVSEQPVVAVEKGQA